MLSVMVAFIVFGFIDNAILVLVGLELDILLASTFSITNSMLAAGLGNTVSDAVGIATGRFVEKIIHKRIPPVKDGDLSKGQVILAEVIGIVVGCILGLAPLLYMG